jgi:hypothetical protein
MCFLYIYTPFHITHKIYSLFYGQAECIPRRLERFAAQQGGEKEIGLCRVLCGKKVR